jgi:hypothetical protein
VGVFIVNRVVSRDDRYSVRFGPSEPDEPDCKRSVGMDKIKFVGPKVRQEWIERGKAEGIALGERGVEGKKPMGIRIMVVVTGVPGGEEVN